MNHVIYGMARAAWAHDGGNAFGDSLDSMDEDMKQWCTDRQRAALIFLANFFRESGDVHTSIALASVLCEDDDK